MKTCSHCGVEKPLEEFHPRHGQCRVCRLAKRRSKYRLLAGLAPEGFSSKPCQRCGTPLEDTPKKLANLRYCGSCRLEVTREGNRNRFRKSTGFPVDGLPENPCGACGVVFAPYMRRQWLCRGCSRKGYKPRKGIGVRNCESCGEVLGETAHRQFCEPCRKRRSNAQHRERYHAHIEESRARGRSKLRFHKRVPCLLCGSMASRKYCSQPCRQAAEHIARWGFSLDFLSGDLRELVLAYREIRVIQFERSKVREAAQAEGNT